MRYKITSLFIIAAAGLASASGLSLRGSHTPSSKADAKCLEGIEYIYGDATHEPDYKKAWHAFNEAMGYGSVTARYYIAEMYNIGLYVPQDMTRYMIHLRQAAALGEVNAIADLGAMNLYGSRRALVPRNEAEGVAMLNTAAEANNLRAMVNLGIAYKNGMGGLSRSGKKAFEYFERAANNGSSQGLVEMANCYIDGIGVEEDPAKAYSLLQQAEQLGNYDASRVIGRMHFHGDGREPSDSLASVYFKKAIRLGSEEAKSDLAWMYLKGGGGSRFHERAFNLFSEAASADVADAIGGMALCHEYGLGTPVDVPLAVSCYKTASEMGDNKSLHRLFNVYRYGSGNVEANLELARKYLDEGVARGDGDALFSMGYEYIVGEIFPKDTEKGLQYINRAADMGNTHALATLGNMYYSADSYVDRDFDKAFAYYQKALRHPEDIDDDLLAKVYRNLSACYRFGRGTEVDINRANTYTIMSNHLGNREMGDVIRFYNTESSFSY